ncbi:unannotated protein [freshwater metagenome]|uniref:Unannotated protein n=1 Tax=freshwater metagenome TaxID=449393 RepID=A0A6J7GWM9_9ZZZZ|nr:hypothetical protein [Actinomycetota bacterium]
MRQRRRTSDRAVVALCTAPARWYVRAGCGGCAVDLLLRVELRHPDCAVHTGPSRCPRHGGADAPFQCEPCRIAR